MQYFYVDNYIIQNIYELFIIKKKWKNIWTLNLKKKL